MATLLDAVIPYSALVLSVGTVVGTAIVSWRSRKTREEATAAALVAKREAEKIAAEKEQITVASAERVVMMMRGELDRKDTRLDRQERTIDRQEREISALRRWISQAKVRFAELGFNGLPSVPQASDADLDSDP